MSELYALNGIDKNYVLKRDDKLKVYKAQDSGSGNNKTTNANNNTNTNNSRATEIYIVKANDTLSEIAQSRSMSLNELYAINSFNKNYILKKGDKIKVYSTKIPIAKTNTTQKNIVTYVVKKGDSLLDIALRESMSFSELLKINNIKDANKHILKVGDKIKVVKLIKPSVEIIKEIKYPDIDFAWPYGGSVTQSYGKNKNNTANRGINISGKNGDNIHATYDGVIDYVGKIRGFGDVIILSHDDDYNTIYAHLSEIEMKAGDIVKKNDIIGKIGSSGFIDDNQLHFKIFYQGRPVDPMKILP